MTTALASLVSGKAIRNDMAMTGEITLTGQVLPVGGIKEKSLAAQRAGIKEVILPSRNEGDVAEIPTHELRRPEVPLRRRDRRGAGDLARRPRRGLTGGRLGLAQAGISCRTHPNQGKRGDHRWGKAEAIRPVTPPGRSPRTRMCKRLIEDEELRDNIRVAFEAAKDAYARMSNGKGPAKSLLDDKKVHRDLSGGGSLVQGGRRRHPRRAASAEASASARRCWSRSSEPHSC